MSDGGAILRRMSVHPRRLDPAPAAPQDEQPRRREPELLLLNQIADGALDPHLAALAQAIDARRHQHHTVRSVTALAMLDVGARVRINQHLRPRYLQGSRGTVTEIDDATATVELDQPVGRFTSGQLRCPPLALDRLGPGQA